MPRISVARRLLRRMEFEAVRDINKYCDLPPRKSKQEMVGQLVSHYGTDLKRLVSAEGPYTLATWNSFVSELGGSPRKSFEAAAAEIEASLDPAFDEIDPDLSVSELREDKSAIRQLAIKLGLERAQLDARLKETHGKTQLSTLVAEIRSEQTVPSKKQGPKSNGVRVASTRVSASTVEPLTIRWMHDQIVDAEALSIAAGFYDVEFVRSLLHRHEHAKRIRLLFNGLGGRRLELQRKDLRELEAHLTTNDRQVEVKLAFAPGLFHTKLFLVTVNGSTRALVGSANATTAAFERNEEILVSLGEAGGLSSYYEAAWDGAHALDDVDGSAKGLIAFFRTGILYFKPSVSLQTTLNPFRELLNLLSDEERAQLGGIALPHADQATGIGPFNLRRAVRQPTTTAVEDPEDANNDVNEPEGAEAKPEKERRASIKPYSIETYFGYWVPSALETELKKKLEKAGAVKKSRWTAFRDDLQAMPKSEVEAKYRDYVKAGKQALSELPNLGHHLSKVYRDPFDETALEGFYARVLRHLEDEDRIDRLSMPFSSGPVPEFWDDKAAYSEFCTTFFDYLDQVARQVSSRPHVPGQLLKKLGVHTSESPGSETLQEQLEDYLVEHGWRDEDWK